MKIYLNWMENTTEQGDDFYTCEDYLRLRYIFKNPQFYDN